jgi:hypothetical protein
VSGRLVTPTCTHKGPFLGGTLHFSGEGFFFFLGCKRRGTAQYVDDSSRIA